jgi:hypothetical protein
MDKTADEKTLRALIERKVEKTRQEAPAPQLSHLGALWNDFSQNDDAGTKKAWQGISTMIKSPRLAVPFLKDRLKPVPRPDPKAISLEARRRMEALLEKTKTVFSGEELCSIRAVEVLEGIGTPDAKEILEILARGGEGAVLTQQAKKALARLGTRASSKE